MTFVGFKTPRIKNDGHLDFIRSLPCACCGNPHQTEAAHIRTASLFHGKRDTGGQEKPSDKWTVPLCGNHHREQHLGNELKFWKDFGIDPFVLALSLHSCSGDIIMAERVIERQRKGER